MSWPDYIIIGIIVISAIISIIRGFVREGMSLAGWIVAVWVSLEFADKASVVFEGAIDTPSLRVGVTFFLLFISVLIISTLVNHQIGKFIHSAGLSGLDRLIGVLFGTIRGMLIVTVFVILLGMTAMPETSWWVESELLQYFKPLASAMVDYASVEIPDDYFEQLKQKF